MKPAKRAIRRHHYNRLKRGRARYHGGYAPQYAGFYANTPKPCSCYACGNPRRHFGQKTVQERRECQGE